MLHLILPLFTISMTSLKNERLSNISHSCVLNPSLWIFPTHLPICLLVPGNCQLNPTLSRKPCRGGEKLAEDLGSCPHSSHCCVTLDRLVPLSGPWVFFLFVCQRSWLDRFLFQLWHITGGSMKWIGSNSYCYHPLPTLALPIIPGIKAITILGLGSVLLLGKVTAAYQNKLDM